MRYDLTQVTPQMLATQRHNDLLSAERRSTEVAGEQRELLAALVAAQTEMVNAQAAADAREIKMLFWSRVAGVGAIAALVVSILAIVVTLLVA